MKERKWVNFVTRGAQAMLLDWPKVLCGFSVKWYGKTRMNFLANAILWFSYATNPQYLLSKPCAS